MEKCDLQFTSAMECVNMQHSPTKMQQPTMESSDIQITTATTTFRIQSDNPPATRTIGKITKEDIVNEVKFFENAVVCFVIGSNSPMCLIILLEGYGKT